MTFLPDYDKAHHLKSLGMYEDIEKLSKECHGADVYKELWDNVNDYRQLLHHVAAEGSERGIKIKIANAYMKVSDKLHGTQVTFLINNALNKAISENQKYSFSVYYKKEKTGVTLIYLLLVSIDKFNIFDALAKYVYTHAVVNKVFLTHEEAAAL